MSIKPSSLLKLSVAGAVLLSVGACKAADKGQGALESQSLSALNLSKNEASVFSKYFETDPCEVDELESLGALAGLGMGENGTNGVSFDSREVNNGQVVYSDLTLKEDGTDQVQFSAKTAVFHCPQIRDDAPNFDRLDLTEIFIKNEDEGVEFTAETLNIANPTATAARSVIDSMIRPNSDIGSDVGFGAISITGAKIKSDDVNGTLEALSWGESRDEDGKGTADLTVDDVNFIVPSQNGSQDMTLDFAGMSIRNLNMGIKKSSQPGISSSGMVDNILGSLNAFEKPYDELVVENLTIDSEGFSVNVDGVEGKTTQKGDIITTRQNLKPIEINLKPALADMPEFQQNYELLKSLDMETIKMFGSSVSQLNSADDSVSVSDGLFIIEDAFRLNFEYNAEGVSEMLRKLKTVEEFSNETEVLAAYDSLKLRNFRLTLEDNSIVDKGLTVATHMTGQSEQSLKLLLTGAVFFAASQAQNEIQAEVYSETVEAFAKFVKNGGTFTIEANPPEPFALAPLITNQGDDMDPESLGFSASQENEAK